MSIKDLTPGQLMSFLVASQTMQRLVIHYVIPDTLIFNTALFATKLTDRSLAMVSILFGQVMKGLTAGARAFEVC